MKKIQLLDCTLRDGGFVNQWRFGEDGITNIFERLDMAGLDIIEIGYLRDYVTFSAGESQFPDTESIGKVLPPKPGKNALVVAIIDYGDCAIDRIGPCSETILDGIRVTFKRKDIAAALEFCRKIKGRGYFISLQPVSFMDYTPQDVLNLVNAANELMPYAVCIVDTYGFMNKRDLLRYYSLMDATLRPDIILGYHSHNNFQLAYSNAIELIEQFTERNMIIDCSVMGMGKGAGNAATELMVLYINNNMGGSYDLNQILEIADTYIEKEKKKNPWGYSLKYYLAASNYCHHQYVSYLLNKKTLSIKSVNEIIANIVPEKKTVYDEKYIIKLYREYQERCVDDSGDFERLRDVIGDRSLLVLSPGSSLMREKEKIDEYIRQKKPYVVSVNHFSDIYRSDAVFVSNHKRYGQIALRMEKYPSDAKVIATSNIDPTTLNVDIRLNYSGLMLDDEMIPDNATLMFLKALIRIGIPAVTMAGFDGYVAGGENYFSDDWDFMGQVCEQNRAIGSVVDQMKQSIEIRFLTKTLYE